MFRSILLVVILSCSSCSSLIDIIDSDDTVVQNMEQKSLHLIFSHNINGELLSCGCQTFPLGGFPQAAGAVEPLKKAGELIYVDTGDTFFPGPKIPDTLKKSLTYSADTIVTALEMMGLTYYLPGDQDFAEGIEFLQKVANKAKFDFLISNLSDPTIIKHKEIGIIERGPNKFFFFGIVDPSVFMDGNYKLFKRASDVMPEILEKLKKKGYQEKNPLHRLIMLSHSGMAADENFATQYPMIDWIIGAHTQNFISYPIPLGKTNIVQVLSRNHYIGHINFSLSKGRSNDDYKLIEVRFDQINNLQDKTIINFINNYQTELEKIKVQEIGFMKNYKNPFTTQDMELPKQ